MDARALPFAIGKDLFLPEVSCVLTNPTPLQAAATSDRGLRPAGAATRKAAPESMVRN